MKSKEKLNKVAERARGKQEKENKLYEIGRKE
jgi:hypothetical protein